MTTAQKQRLTEVWEVPTQKWSVNDSLNEDEKKKVDGKHIIGIVEGQFFVPDGNSRNGRHYPKNVWDTALKNEDVSKKLSGLTMYGCIGHDDRPISDQDLREGNVSHVMERLWIDERGRGMGRALILGTNAGNNLLTYLKAGSNLKTSSRASGGFLENQEYNGMLIVDPNNYCLETFDFVLDPGFIETNPMLVEKKISNTEGIDNQRSEDLMNEAYLNDLKERNQKIETLNTSLLEENRKLNVEVTKLSESIKRMELQEKALKEKLSKAEKVLKAYRDIGSVNEINLASQKAIEYIQKLKSNRNSVNERHLKDLGKFREIGTPEEITETLKKCEKVITEYKELGSIPRIRKMVAEFNHYKKIGTPKQIVENIKRAEKVLEGYLEYGSINDVKEITAKVEKFVNESRKTQKRKAVKELSEKYGQSLELVSKLLERFNVKDAEEFLKGIGTSSTYKTSVSESKKLAGNSERKAYKGINESCQASRYFRKIRKV